MNWPRSMPGVLFSLLAVLVPAATTCGQGIMLSSSGPVNRSMGGAAVAAPLDAIGALRWNPATISGLPCSELEFGVDLLWPITAVSSSVAGLGAGATDAEPGVAAVPTIGWVHKIDDSPFTIGLALIGVAGARTNYPASTTNPIFLPQPNAPGVPGGFGRVNSSAQYLDLAPTVSYAVSESLSVGVSPIIELAEVALDPLVIASPDDADGSGVPRYPTAAGTHMSWGAGVQLGAYYIVNPEWRLGAALRTPTWMQSFQYLTVDEVGTPRRGRFRVDLPLVVSTGISYAGFESTLIAFDVRYADYAQTAGFGPEGFNPDGSLRGLGWKSVLSCALGVQRELTERLSARCGYTYLQNPTPQSLTGINIAAPLHTQHQIGLGGTYVLAPNVNLNLAYTYYLPHSITGPILTPNGPVPGTSVTNDLSAHVGSFGIQVLY